MAAEDGVIVMRANEMRANDELVAYDVFNTEAPEQAALSPSDRVRAILERAGTDASYTAGSIARTARPTTSCARCRTSAAV